MAEVGLDVHALFVEAHAAQDFDAIRPGHHTQNALGLFKGQSAFAFCHPDLIGAHPCGTQPFQKIPLHVVEKRSESRGRDNGHIHSNNLAGN